jgi:hypothetical protein
MVPPPFLVAAAFPWSLANERESKHCDVNESDISPLIKKTEENSWKHIIMQSDLKMDVQRDQ